jgi:hypothetical protein
MVLFEYLYFLVHKFTSSTKGYDPNWKGALLVSVYVVFISLPLISFLRDMGIHRGGYFRAFVLIYIGFVFIFFVIYFARTDRRDRILRKCRILSRKQKILLSIVLIALSTSSWLYMMDP